MRYRKLESEGQAGFPVISGRRPEHLFQNSACMILSQIHFFFDWAIRKNERTKFCLLMLLFHYDIFQNHEWHAVTFILTRRGNTGHSARYFTFARKEAIELYNTQILVSVCPNESKHARHKETPNFTIVSHVQTEVHTWNCVTNWTVLLCTHAHTYLYICMHFSTGQKINKISRCKYDSRPHFDSARAQCSRRHVTQWVGQYRRQNK